FGSESAGGGATPRAEGATWWGVPSGSTRMAWVMFCTMAEPGSGWAVQRAMAFISAAGGCCAPAAAGPGAMVRGSLGKTQRVYSAAGSEVGLSVLIQSMAAKT